MLQRRMGRSWVSGRVVVLLLAGWLTGCAPGDAPSNEQAPSDAIRLDIDAAEADRLLGFYLGSYLGPEGGDPVAAGLLEKRENSWFLRSPSSVAGAHQALQSFFDRFREAGNVPADTLESFLRASYYTARQTPPTLDAFRQLSGAWSEPDWFRVDVTGSMVPAPRVTWVRR
ncbi:MAG: hypothetical protein O2899_07855, partial [Bacteroidetes bacterium]|nr:hypothetical protein [Bacteroidota bacterium]